jgi:rare lipoprotein A
MFDLGSLRKDNNRWSVRMKRTSFRTARQLSSSPSIRKLGIGVILMGLALTASAKDGAKDGTPSALDQSAGNKAHAKASPRSAKPRRWLQTGLASWYGSRFQGHRTAAGERFDMNTMTCAHPTLPMGTWLRVTNLRNRRTAFVRVNDRGPVTDGRIVDLSYAAAQSVGLKDVGRVRLEAVRDGDPILEQALVAQLQMPVIFGPVAR